MIKCINSLGYWHRPSDIITHTIFGISHHFDANIVWRLFLIWPFDESSVWKHGKLKCFPCIQSRLKPTESLDDRVNDPRDLHKRRKSQKYHWNLPAFQSCIFSNRIANHSMPSFEYEVNGIAELSRRIPKEYYQSAFISAFGQHLIQSLFFSRPDTETQTWWYFQPNRVDMISKQCDSESHIITLCECHGISLAMCLVRLCHQWTRPERHTACLKFFLSFWMSLNYAV